MRISLLALASGMLCVTGFGVASAATTNIPCHTLDRAYERRVCLRIQQYNAGLSGYSLARPSLTGSTAIARPRRLPADYVSAGVTLWSNGKTFFVKSLVLGLPADVAGMLPGDEVLELDEQPVKINLSTDELARRLGGSEGTTVTVRVGRRNTGTVDVTILRARTTLEDSVAEMKGTLAYINVRSFSKDAAERTRDFLTRQAEVKNPHGIIVDLRGNPGGNLDDIQAFLGFFLPEKTTVARLQTPVAFTAVVTTGTPLMPLDTPVIFLVTEDGPPSVALVAGGMKNVTRNRVRTIQAAAVAGRVAHTPLTILDAGKQRTFRSPGDAFMAVNSDPRTYLDAAFIHRTADARNPAGQTADPALDLAIDLLQ